jgi:hypothetical protein
MENTWELEYLLGSLFSYDDASPRFMDMVRFKESEVLV